jgi:hypothetical protein
MSLPTDGPWPAEEEARPTVPVPPPWPPNTSKRSLGQHPGYYPQQPAAQATGAPMAGGRRRVPLGCGLLALVLVVPLAAVLIYYFVLR